MMKKYTLFLITCLCFVLSGFGQIAIIDFETNLAGYSHTPSQLPSADPGDQYFHRAIPSDASIYEGSVGPYTNTTGSWLFVGSNPNTINSGNPGILTLNPINISGFTNLELSIDWGAVPNDWDDNEGITVEYRYDGTGAWTTLYSFGHNNGTNDPLVLSGNATGGSNTANGTVLTYALQTITTNNFTGSGTNINIRIVSDANANYEAFGLDNIVLNGTASCTPPADPIGNISGTTPACNSTILTYSGTTIPGTVDYWQTTATGTSTANNATGTFNATATGTYYVRTFLTATSCWSAGAASYAVVINSAPTISGQPADATSVIPNTATFSVIATGSPAPTYQWQVNSGLGWANVTGGTGATTDTYTTGATSAPMNNNQYRCVVTNTCGSTTSNAAILTLTNDPPNNVTGIRGCFEDDSIILDWNAPATGPTPTGYVVFALDGGTDPAGTKTDANTYTADSNFSTATPVTPASLGRVVYKGTATTATITGLTEDNNYSFTTYAYVGETLTGWANGATNGSTVTNGLAQGDVRNLVATPLTNQVNLSWNNPLPTSCFDELIIVANTGAVSFTPSGSYAPIDVNYSTPNSVIYATTGTVSSKALNGLVNGTNYCFKVYIRRGGIWSDGVEVCTVPSLTYCASNGNGTDGFFTLINNVEFNTINNPSAVTTDNAYSDFTSISTTVTLGETYNLNVRVETDGAFTTTARAWIDWNNNGDFSDSNEVYELGNAFNVIDGSTDGSPLAIEVPTNAVIGATRMRISNRYDTVASTPCLTGFDGEVEDYTINIVQPTNAEINIKGNNITIPSGFNAPYGLNNTLFGSTNVGANGPEKIYFVENIGATNLNLSGAPRVQIIGAHPGDFIVTLQPAATVGSLSNSEFRIQFFPSADGTRTATVSITNSDSDENPYLFDIEGTAVCSTTLTSTMWPLEGPENTEVTITSANDLTGATATINGLAMTTISSSSTELVVSVPAGASSGNISVLFSTGCSSTNAFTIIDNVIGGCETATASTVPTDLFISEISDASSGSSSLIEIFNGTAASIDLSDYSIRVFNNGSATPSTTANLTGILAPGGVHVISVGTTSCDLTGNGLAGGLPNQTFNSAGGINFDNNSSDMIELYNGTTATPIDYFGVPGSNTWANSLGINGDGVNYRRQNTATNLPDLTFDITDWDEIDWTTCGDSDYSQFGQYDFSLGIPPSVSVLSTPTFDCTNTIQLSVTGSQGVPGGLELTYQWYYLVPNTSAFVEIPVDPDFNNDVTSSTLDIINPIPYLNYQFYCQVRENDVTCYTASNAVKLAAIAAIWTSSGWSSPPTSSKIVIIDEHYDTGININGETNFQACQLIVNAGKLLTINTGDYVEVFNNVEVSGDGSGNDGILVLDKGSFVQRGDGSNAGTYTLQANARTQVNKRTAPLNNWYEYTYWSSPVVGETIGNGLMEAHPTRRYWYNGQNYLDSTSETNNNNATVAGQDDIDDNGNDWQFANNGDTMLPGIGYAAMHDAAGFGMPGANYEYTFEGALNTGDFTVPIYRNDAETNDNNWNFIGNPYPSAIDADLFLASNTIVAQDVEEFPTGSGTTTGAIFLWSQNSGYSDTNNGNEVLNFAQSDYAVINGTGQTAGGDGVIPDRFIPSGQGFFISLSDAATTSVVSGTIRTADVVFLNSMRTTGNNNQFFRTTNDNELEKLWLNLTSDNGVFNQILIGYVPGATNDYDGMYYDAPKNLSSDVNAMIYSTADNSDKKLAIQGKDPNSLDLDEIIPVGFYTGIEDATLYTISINHLGAFFEENNVYLIDNEINTIHDLTASNYTFTSDVGEFNNRFEIVFRENALSVDEYTSNSNDITIIELDNNHVKFKLDSGTITLKQIEIIDLLGRTVYTFKGSSNVETYNLSNLSSSTYMARITLSNDQVIVKKAIKK